MWGVVLPEILSLLFDNHVVKRSTVLLSHRGIGGVMLVGTENLPEVVRRLWIMVGAVSCFVDWCQTMFSCQLSRLGVVVRVEEAVSASKPHTGLRIAKLEP